MKVCTDTGWACTWMVCACRYERQIKELKAELAMRDTLTGRGQVNYNDLTDAEAADLKVLVRQFLEGNATVDQLPCDTLKQVKEAYKQMQSAYQAAKAVSSTLLVLHWQRYVRDLPVLKL